MAIWQRRPKPGLIVHSDRGSQYASKAYRRLLAKHGFIGSMSRKGNCWDNSVESFFASLKKERVHWHSYQTRYEAQQDVLDSHDDVFTTAGDCIRIRDMSAPVKVHESAMVENEEEPQTGLSQNAFGPPSLLIRSGGQPWVSHADYGRDLREFHWFRLMDSQGGQGQGRY